MVAVVEYISGLLFMLADTVLRVVPIPVSDASAEHIEESANVFYRLRLLRKHHPDLLRRSRRIPVRCLAEGSFRAKHRRGPYDSRGLLLFADGVLKYWDLGKSTLLEPYEYQPGEATASLHTKQPYRPGERVWVELEENGLSRYVQYDAEDRANEKTRRLFDEIRTVLDEPQQRTRTRRRRMA